MTVRSLCSPWRLHAVTTFPWKIFDKSRQSSRLKLYHYQTYKRALHDPIRSFSSYNTRPLFYHILTQDYGDKLAIVDSIGQHTYKDLLNHSTALAPFIIANAQNHDENGHFLNGERIAFLCPNNVTYVISQWAVWMAGGVAVPLCEKHPPAEIEYVVEDSQSSLLISTSQHQHVMRPIAEKLNLKYLVLNESALSDKTDPTGFEQESSSGLNRIPSILSSVDADSVSHGIIEGDVLRNMWDHVKWKNRNALIIYTSGTTGRPKGAITTFGAYQTQVSMMIENWEWSIKDVALHTLPLHHIHGVVNLLGCPLWAGATIVMLPKFEADKVWELLLSNAEPRINVFMAVPTIYAKLIEYCHKIYTSSKQAKSIKALLRENVRLMVSGSAALPVPILNEWEDITGHRLLERYGMTEIGMALTNPLHGDRLPGAVGIPFPTVQVRIVDHDGTVLVEGDSHGSKVETNAAFIEGELQVRGPGIFKEYWNKPQATAESFMFVRKSW